MIIETKWNLGDLVYGIWRSTEWPLVQCEACGGVGTLTGMDGSTYTCLRCKGEKLRPQKPKHPIWIVAYVEPNPIGQIICNNWTGTMKIAYTLDIGSTRTAVMGCHGVTIWPEADLFLTMEAAQVECDGRNKEEGGK